MIETNDIRSRQRGYHLVNRITELVNLTRPIQTRWLIIASLKSTNAINTMKINNKKMITILIAEPETWLNH